MSIDLQKSARAEAQEKSTVPTQKPIYKAPARQNDFDANEKIPRAQQIQDNDNIKYGGFWRRLVAFVIDYIVIIVSFFVLFLFGALLSNYDYIGILGFCLMLFAIIIIFLYTPLLESSKLLATFGKYVMGLKVVGKDGGRISVWRALGRYICRNIGMSLLYLGVIWIGFDNKKQGLHDHLAETFVVTRDTDETAIAMATGSMATNKWASLVFLIIGIFAALAIVVILAAVVAAFVFGMGSGV
jgi:uncharacterized RDD family membrane protein YckC